MAADAIIDGLFRVEGESLTLLGGYSASSGLRHFPRRPVCPFTGADDVTDVDLTGTGRLLWWTSVQTAPPGYQGPVPYGLGVVALDGEPELRVVGRLTVSDPSELDTGDRMRTVPVELDTEDGPRVTWAFEPIEAPA
jgi:uncharacterized OB-fold protein